MSKTRTVLSLLILLAPTIVAQGASATPSQAAKAAGAGPTLTLTAPIAAPGERAVVMVRLDGTNGPVQSLTMEVEFPTEKLAFVEARPAFHQDFTVEPKLTPGKDPKGKSRLLVTATSVKPIEPGDAVELVFEVAKTVYTNQDAALTGVSSSLKTAGGQVEPVTLQDGKVTISVAALVFGCFFYMH